MLLKVVNRKGEANTVISLVPPLVFLPKNNGGTKIVDSHEGEYHFSADGSYEGMTVSTVGVPLTLPPDR